MTNHSHVIKCTATVFLRRFWRSREFLGLLVFAAVICWYDFHLHSTNPSNSSYAATVFLACWSAVLLGYNTFSRLRDERALRLLLLRSTSPAHIAVGNWLGATLVSSAVTVVAFIVMRFTSGTGIELHDVAALALLLLGIAGFTAYAQAVSAILPRDTAAVLGVGILVFGSMTPDRWMPPMAPEIVRQTVKLIWTCIPTSLKVSNAIDALSAFAGLSVVAPLIVYPIVGLIASSAFLGMPRWKKRSLVEST